MATIVYGSDGEPINEAIDFLCFLIRELKDSKVDVFFKCGDITVEVDKRKDTPMEIYEKYRKKLKEEREKEWLKKE